MMLRTPCSTRYGRGLALSAALTTTLVLLNTSHDDNSSLITLDMAFTRQG